MRAYSADKINEFIDHRLAKFQRTLVEEFNDRYREKRPLRFQIADAAGVGTIVAGYRRTKLPSEIRFQNSLHKTTPAEFEKLAAIVLRVLGCTKVFATPSSLDQGIDAFGYLDRVRATPYGVTHGLTWIAQAKHYVATHVSTGDVRELVGSKELLVARVFSTVDDRYKELRLRLYAPTAVALITTEEVPSTVRRLADGAGIFVFAASDLFYLLGPLLSKNNVKDVRLLIRSQSRDIVTLS
jgi:hypothetical protein